nr:DUF2203 family protein [Acidithiobacillus concretivorus]
MTVPETDGLHGHGDSVFAIQRPGQIRVFTLLEAQQIFPLVRNITAQAFDELSPVLDSMRANMENHLLLQQQEIHYEEVVQRWINKMERLGVVVSGLWLVDFDTGDGYLCWRHPETVLGYYHGHEQGFGQRRPLLEIIREQHPEWADCTPMI